MHRDLIKASFPCRRIGTAEQEQRHVFTHVMFLCMLIKPALHFLSLTLDDIVSLSLLLIMCITMLMSRDSGLAIFCICPLVPSNCMLIMLRSEC
jgi:hypothetical protein